MPSGGGTALCRDPLPGPALKLIVANEFAERFCFYGTRSLLVIFLTKQVHLSDAHAVSIYSLYVALSYFSPLLGGYVADVWLGRFMTIICFNAAYLIGVSIWAATSTVNSFAGCLCGLALMALGAGGIKPNISPLGADQLADASEKQLVEFFFWFYFAINFGVAIAYVVVPLVRDVAGYPAAISLGLGMLTVSLALLVAGRPWYRLVPPSGTSMYATVLRVVVAADACRCLRQRGAAALSPALADLPRGAAASSEASPLLIGAAARQQLDDDPAESFGLDSAAAPKRASEPAQLPTGSATAHPTLAAAATCCSAYGWLERARGAVPDADIDGTIRVFRLLPVFACLPIFWMLDDSQDSVWTLQRRQMDLCAGGGFCIAVEQLGAVNPVLIMALVPLFNVFIFPFLHAQPHAWLRPRPVRQMAVGMQLAAVAFVGSAVLQHYIDTSPAASVSVFWQVPQILVLTTAEVLVSATGLEFAYSQAPPSFKGSIVAVYYLSIACGDLVAAVVYSSLDAVLSSVQLLLLYAILMSLTGVAFIAVACMYVSAPHQGAEHRDGAPGPSRAADKALADEAAHD